MAAVTRRKLTPWMGRSLEEIQERWVENGDRMLDESDLYMRRPGPDALPG
jgi:hypothetical protein